MSPSYLESYEDNLKIDKDKCIFCGQCADRCILDNIRLNLAPCRAACPMGVNVQGYVQLIKRGEYAKARDLIREKLPFPEIICMVCHHPCESNCERGRNGGEPIAIRALKRFLFDAAATPELPQKAASTGKRIAVVGAGPAGLVAAYDLALQGHAVHLYEAANQPGGMLVSGIPSFRLPRDVVEKELAVLPTLGVNMVNGCKVGKDIGLRTLMDSFDAVVLANGLGKSKKLGVPGEDLQGVHSGLTFLSEARQGAGPTLSGTVLVSGGGNMAVDAAMTALRQGADKVIVLTLEGEDELPAFEAEVTQARREGVTFRHSCGIKRIEDRDGNVAGVELDTCLAVFDEQGNFAPQFGTSSEKIAADALIVAIGLERDGETLTGSGLDLADVRRADPLTLRCGESNVFAAGDVLGAGSVIKAMAMGREAAISAHRLAMGEHLSFERAYPGPVITDFNIDHTYGLEAARVDRPLRLFKGKGDYAVLEYPLSEDQAVEEASRCHSCGGPLGKNRTCWFCLPCEVDCPQKALWVDIPYLLR